MNVSDRITRKLLFGVSHRQNKIGVDRLLPLGRLKYQFEAKTYTQHLLRNVFLGNSNAKIERPIFIVGAPRSGTTFLGDCMSHIDSIAYFFEPVYTKAVGYMLASGEISTYKAEREFRKTYGNLMREYSGLRFCEKTPTNVFILKELLEWFPDAKFIHIIRDGVDMAASHVQKGWLTAAKYEPLSYEIGGYRNGPVPQFWVEPSRHDEFRSTTDFNRSIWAWWTHVRAGRDCGRALGPERYLEVRYEEMLKAPVAEGGRMIDFLTGTDEDCASCFIQALQSGSLKSVGKGRRSVSQNDLDQMMPEARVLLEELGY